MAKDSYLRLGEFLLKEGIITASQLEKAITVQRQEGGRLGEVLIRMGVVKEEQVLAALGKQLNTPYFSLGTGMLKPAMDQGLENLIPHDFALKNAVLPLSRMLRSLTVALSDPLDILLIDSLRKLTGSEINPVIAMRSDILKAIEEFYGKSSMLQDIVDSSYDIDSSFVQKSEDLGQELSLDKLIARAEEAPVVKLVDLIIRQAIGERASDIHIEPFKD
ncbi:MAG: type II secretion system protein GspE, partial [Candidatus Omnitrophota bacterium]|nr:type II secretion system protein GspE [Candidatus Omnitrophota bacterium]